MAAMARMESNLKSELRSEFRSGLADLRSEFKADMAALRSELKLDMANLESELTWQLVFLSFAIASLVVSVAAAGLMVMGFVFGWWDRLKKVVSSPPATPGT